MLFQLLSVIEHDLLFVFLFAQVSLNTINMMSQTPRYIVTVPSRLYLIAFGCPWVCVHESVCLALCMFVLKHHLSLSEEALIWYTWKILKKKKENNQNVASCGIKALYSMTRFYECFVLLYGSRHGKFDPANLFLERGWLDPLFIKHSRAH